MKGLVVKARGSVRRLLEGTLPRGALLQLALDVIHNENYLIMD